MPYTELREHYAVTCPKGPGHVIGVIDYGPQSALIWVVVCSDAERLGECWQIDNTEIRFATNWTMGRRCPA